MKKMHFLKLISFAAVLPVFSLILASCDKDDDEVAEKIYTLSGNASGSQQVPIIATSATATLSGTYNSRTNALNYTINWSGLSGVATGIHIHGPAAAGVNADIIHGLTITTNGVDGTASGSLVIADDTETHLLESKLYYNLHTVLNPDGEIRGQITATAE